jgi:hypothetical protein
VQKKTAFDVTLRRTATGEKHTRLIFADNATRAREAAIARARLELRKTMAERKYEPYEVVSCERRSR